VGRRAEKRFPRWTHADHGARRGGAWAQGPRAGGHRRAKRCRTAGWSEGGFSSRKRVLPGHFRFHLPLSRVAAWKNQASFEPRPPLIPALRTGGVLRGGRVLTPRFPSGPPPSGTRPVDFPSNSFFFAAMIALERGPGVACVLSPFSVGSRKQRFVAHGLLFADDAAGQPVRWAGKAHAGALPRRCRPRAKTVGRLCRQRPG